MLINGMEISMEVLISIQKQNTLDISNMMANKSLAIFVIAIIALCHLCSSVSPTQPQCLEHERSLLLQLKREISINYTRLSNIQQPPLPKVWSWNDTGNHKDNCCFWEGVTCDSHSGNVVGLDLSRSSIIDGINSVFRLEGLRYLDLSNNKIKGNISPSACDLRFLLVLDLSNNHFNGSIPSCLSSLSLRVLSIRNNELSGMLPTGFGDRCSLRTLDVNRNNLHGQIPESLGLCKYLQVVDVGKNNLTGKFPVLLEDLPELRVLVLRSNQFGGSIDSQNPNGFPHLQILDVSSNKFVGKLPLGWFTSWEVMMKSAANVSVLLDVSNNDFTGEIPDTIAQLESLQLLNLSSNHFTGHIPSSFGQLRRLESLDLSSNNLSGNIPSLLTELTFLSFLNMSNNLLSGIIPHGSQFDTFTADCYYGNPDLCGKPLPKPCFEVKSSTSSATNSRRRKCMIDWDCFRAGIASSVILGMW